MFFCLVLYKIVFAIATDEHCSSFLFHAWYHEDGVDAGPKPLSIIQEHGLTLGLFISAAKCELYSLSDLSMFPSEMKRSN